MPKNTEFNPDWVSPPGDTISLLVAQEGLNKACAAKRLHLTQSAYDELIDGRMPVTEQLAHSLAELIGPSQKFWINRAERYSASLRRAALRLQREIAFPVADMKKFGWIPSRSSDESDLALEVASFMGVRSISEFEDAFGTLEEALAFRRSATFASEIGAVSAWYRAAELRSQELGSIKWSSASFLSSLHEARSYSLIRDPALFVPKLIDLFASCGVALCILPAPSGCPVSGIAMVSRGRAMISLSSRHLTDDHFWFSLFHEAAHLILHSGKLSIETEGGVTEEDEVEANNFAADYLVPKDRQADLMSLPINKFSIARFAKSVGVAPGIVVGQLQHKGRLRFNQMNYLKARYKWRRAILEMA
ncbi:ImmA/IrrE family metallo-endopeptidase [Stenotrophomonas rhizophila]|uniref:ImmA/IrrE family metallo-endopeptidase n=1 Tax=Stenotrophomonas rhizophila TaxID=216778 RepID=UPI001AEBD44F|nr:ImmA/IrrE family metallo-endopeptidase [Stenotrophomonas rhizophila]